VAPLGATLSFRRLSVAILVVPKFVSAHSGAGYLGAPMYVALHVHPSVVRRPVVRPSWRPVDRRYAGCSGIARSAAGYRWFAAGSGAALRHRQ
jgi:hypothetical protein